MQKIIFMEGLSCQHCVMAVKSELMEVEGVISINVDLESKSATVEVNEGVSDEALRNAVVEAGFEVVSINND